MSNEALITNVDLDLTGVSAEPPKIDQQTKKCRVGECGVSLTKDKKRRVVVPLILEEPAVDVSGNPVAVGRRVTKSFLIDASGGWTAERGAEELLRCKMAIEGIDEQAAKASPRTDFSQWTGRFVMATFYVTKNDQQDARLARA